MTSELTGPDNLENSIKDVNRQLLENQSFLCQENKTLQDDVHRLSQHLEELRKSSVDPTVLNKLVLEKNHLTTLNETLKSKIKILKSPPPNLSKDEIERQKIEKQELKKSLEELDVILTKINNRSETFEITIPEESTVKEMAETLTKRLEEEQRRSDEAIETIRKLRNDDEKMILKDKLSELKQLVTDLEIENIRLKFETDQLHDDIQRYLKELAETKDDLRMAKKETYHLEDEKDKLKQIIGELESEKIKLKKDMIEELTEANRAKRISADTELALQHISEAYENKRKEVREYQNQLEDANNIIVRLRAKFEHHQNDDPQY